MLPPLGWAQPIWGAEDQSGVGVDMAQKGSSECENSGSCDVSLPDAESEWGIVPQGVKYSKERALPLILAELHFLFHYEL